MKAYLEKLRNNKRQKLDNLKKKIRAAETAQEVRELSEQAEEIKEEITELDEKIESLDAGEGDGEGNPEPPAPQPTEPQSRGALIPMATYGQNTQFNSQKSSETDMFDTIEYRTAFMNFACRNVPIPANLVTRENGTIATTDGSAVIPTSITTEIIQQLESYGNVYAKVRKMNIQGGVRIPVLTLKPTASWITEGSAAAATKAKAMSNDAVAFNYYGLECKISQTLLANVVTLKSFTDLFVPLATEAIVKTLEIGVFNGTGSGQMLGITKDPRIKSAQVITLAPSEFNWGTIKKKVFANIKKSYRNGEFFMAQGTFEGYIDGMVDANGQPIGRINYGIDGGETYRFGGKNVETVEDDIIADYDTASKGDVVMVFGNMSDYVINSNLQMTVTHWTDPDTHEVKDSVMLIVDGKVADTNGWLIIKKGEDTTTPKSAT